MGQLDNNIFYDNLRSLVLERVGSEEQLLAIEELGLLNEDPVAKLHTPLDSLSHFLSKKLALRKFLNILLLREAIFEFY